MIVTTLYWGLVYKPNDEEQRLSVNNILVHVINSVLIIVEMLVSAIPFRIVHVIYPIVFEAIYTGFTIVFFASGGVNL